MLTRKRDLARVTGFICPLPAGLGAASTSCQPCAAGTYMDLTGSDQCTPCEPGTYGSLIGATSCAPCAPGSR